jgi:hypothetical protein
MAYNTNTPRAEYTASATQTVFPFLFKIFATSDIKVYQTLAGATPDDVADILVLTTDYTVTINGDAGGEVTLNTGASVNDKITLVRSLDVTRSIEYQQNGDLLASTLNADQEYQTYLIADKDLEAIRSLRFPDSAQNVNSELPTPEALKVMRWNNTETALENIAINDDSVFVNVFNVDSMSGLLSVNNLSYETVNVRGYTTANDGGGGLFNYDATKNKATANAGTIIDPSVSLALQGTGVGLGCWVRQYSGAINVKWFGAKGDGVTDDATTLNAAIDAGYNVGKDVFIPAGTYYLTSDRINIRDLVSAKSYKNITVFGEGWNTIIHGYSDGGRDIFQMNNVHDITIKDLAVTSTIANPTNQGTNGFSITADCKNITIKNVYCYDLDYTDNGTYGDGGAAFSVQTHLAKNITIQNCKAYNCKYGHDFNCNGASLITAEYNSYNIRCLNNNFEYCYRGIVYGYSDTLTSTLKIQGLNILIDGNNVKDCQNGIALGRLTNATITNNTITNRLTTQPAWLASFTDVYGLLASGVFDSSILNNTIDYKNGNYAMGIGGAFAVSATIKYSDNLVVLGNNLKCDTASSTYSLFAFNSSGNIVQNSIFFNTISDGNGIDPLFYTDSYNNFFADDTEDGAWTPILVDANLVDEGATYSLRIGTYKRIRNMVFFSCYVGMSSLGTLNGNAFIQGLPFTSSSTSGNLSAVSVGLFTSASTAAGTVVQAFVGSGVAYIQLRKTLPASTTGMTNITCAEISASGVIALSGHYFI